MPADNTAQIDREKLESVQRLNSLLTLIAKVMVAQDLRTKEAIKEKIADGDINCQATNQPNQV